MERKMNKNIYYKFQVNIPGTREKEYRLISKIMKDLGMSKYDALIKVFTYYAKGKNLLLNTNNDNIEIKNELIEIGSWSIEKTNRANELLKTFSYDTKIQDKLYNLMIDYCDIPGDFGDMTIIEKDDFYRGMLWSLNHPEEGESK